ncbi:MAG: LamG domain-containing protein [Bacteroidetes bacterium]|nr:LamG domain-containing protein [Bacteroidota bacterium]
MTTKRTLQFAKNIMYALLIINCQLSIINCFSQGAAFNTTGAAADNSAMLDVSSTTSPYQGTLITRLTTENRDLISSPATGLLIYNTDCNEFQYYNGVNWTSLLNASSVIASISIAANPSGAICSGTSVTFTATPVNGGTTPSYQWKLNNVNVGTNSISYTNASLYNSDKIKCVMTSNATCVSGSPATSNEITMEINPTLPASVSIAATATTICSGISVTLTATPTNGGTPSYQWKLNGSNVGTNSNTYTSTTLANNDAITCTMTSNATPCLTGSPATSNTVTMTVTTLCNNIFAYWKFDGTSGNTSDATGNGYTLTNNNSVAYNTGIISNGIDGGSGNTNKDMTNSSGAAITSSTSPISISGWINFYNNNNNYNVLAGVYNGASGIQLEYRITCAGDGDGNMQFTATRYKMQSTAYQVTYTPALTTSTWYQVVLTFDGSNLTLYVNGVSRATGTTSGTGVSNDGTGIEVMSRALYAGNFAQAKIDEVGIWTRALSPSEVLQLYNNGTALQYPF